MRRLAFRGGGGGVTTVCLTKRGASDYSGTFKDRELAEERRWVQKHEQEVASIAAERKKEMETIPGSTWRHRAFQNAVPRPTLRRQATKNGVSRPSKRSMQFKLSKTDASATKLQRLQIDASATKLQY